MIFQRAFFNLSGFKQYNYHIETLTKDSFYEKSLVTPKAINKPHTRINKEIHLIITLDITPTLVKNE